MKRKGLLIAFLFLLALMLVLGSSKEILTARGEVIVSEAAYDLITGLGDTAFWAGFLHEVPQTVLNIGPGRFVVLLYGNSSVMVVVTPVGADSALVLWERKLTLAGWVQEKTGRSGLVSAPLARLKAYAEDPGKRYGFPMKMVPVSTRFFLTVRDSVAESAGAALPHLDSVLNRYAAAHALTFDNPAWFISLLPLSNGQTRVALARSLSAPVKTEGAFTCMELPATGRLLQVSFTGNLKNFPGCETAAARYVLAQHLKPLAPPIQQYKRLPVTAEDSSMQSVEYFLPVY